MTQAPIRGTTEDPAWVAANDDRPAWWGPLAPNPWPGHPNAYPCPWGCNATGKKPEFSHIQNGVCFGCKGLGWNLGKFSARPSQPRPQEAAPQPRRWRKEGRRIVPA